MSATRTTLSLRRMKWKPLSKSWLEKTLKFLLQQIERLLEIAIGIPEVLYLS